MAEPRVKGFAEIDLSEPCAVVLPAAAAAVADVGTLVSGAFTVRDVTDSAEGVSLPFVTSVTVPGAAQAPDDLLTVDVTTWTGEDGEPLRNGKMPAVRDGKPVSAVFTYVLGFRGAPRG